MAAPANRAEWTDVLRARVLRQNRELGFKSQHAFEMFTVTAWGAVPTVEQLLKDFPPITPKYSHVKKLRQRLQHWAG